MTAQGNPEAAMMAQMMGVLGQQPEPQPGTESPQAEKGRGTDRVLGHLTPGEIVVPKEMTSDPAIKRALKNAFRRMDVDMNQYVVGHESNSINPETGNPEFGLFGGAFGKAKKGLRQGFDAVFRPNRLKEEVEKVAREQGRIAQEDIDRKIADYERRLQQQIDIAKKDASKASGAAKAEALISQKKFEKVRNELGRDVGMGAAPSVAPSSGPQTGSSIKRIKKAPKRTLGGPTRPV